MEKKEYLTTEKIRQKFGNQFDLVNYAIKLAENMILTGRDPRIKTDSQNRSLQVLGEILSGKDRLDEIVIPTTVGEQQDITTAAEVLEAISAKNIERKKGRKAAVE